MSQTLFCETSTRSRCSLYSSLATVGTRTDQCFLWWPGRTVTLRDRGKMLHESGPDNISAQGLADDEDSFSGTYDQPWLSRRRRTDRRL